MPARYLLLHCLSPLAVGDALVSAIDRSAGHSNSAGMVAEDESFNIMPGVSPDESATM